MEEQATPGRGSHARDHRSSHQRRSSRNNRMTPLVIHSPVPRQLSAFTERPTLFLTPHSSTRFWEFFTANIRNKNTRRAYFQAVCRFSRWCESHELNELSAVRPIHVAAYIEELQQALSRPSVKQHLAALKMLFDWLVVGQVIPSNPAQHVRGPKHSQRKGKTPVLNPD